MASEGNTVKDIYIHTMMPKRYMYYYTSAKKNVCKKHAYNSEYQKKKLSKKTVPLANLNLNH